MLKSPPTVSTISFIALSVFTGLVGAFIHPLMSYFLIDGLNVAPMYIGVYMVLVTLSGLLISQILGAFADKGFSARKMYILANAGIILALLVYINTTGFIYVVLAGVFFMAFGNASMPQVLTLSRQWANHNPVNITQFNARIRAGISFAWMLGPPVAFSLLAIIGFTGVFTIAILVASLSILFVWQFLPEQSKQKKVQVHDSDKKVPSFFWCLVVAITLGSMANNMYTSALPLYTIKELNLPSFTPGVLMGIVAGLEIPIMLFCGRLTRFFKKKSLMMFSFGCAVIFYVGIFYAENLWQLIALQLVNAIFYGLFAGLGLTLLQEQLPSRIGFTAAVYGNAFKVGVMIGVSLTGIIAQYFSFQYALLGAILTMSFAIFFMILFSIYKARAEAAAQKTEIIG